MISLKTPLTLAFASTTLASPLLVTRQCAESCGNTCYAQSDIDAAVSTGCSYFQPGSTVGRNRYPHEFYDNEGFPFPDTGPYYEFPILADGSQYDGQLPGPDRVVFTGDCLYEGVLTHTGAGGNNFLQCYAGQ